MKKILFWIHDLGPGGAEKVLVNLVNHMDPAEYDITVMTLMGGGVNEQFLRPHIHYRSIFPRVFPGNSHLLKLLTPRQLHKLWIRERYDIEVAYLEGPSARIVAGCPDPDTRLVGWIHVEQHTPRIAAKAFRSFRESEACYRRFDRVVCVSQSVKEDFQRLYPAVERVEVRYNTNETAKIRAMKDDPVMEDFWQTPAVRLCGVGKIMPIKGFDKLARIHRRLRAEGFPVQTLVLGIGPEQARIEAYLKEQGLTDSFFFLGYQTNPYKYVSRCDAFVCASTAEGFSTAATEALIVGTPVVTTPVAGMKEMLGDHNEYGIVTEMSEEALYAGIRELIGNPARLAHYKTQAALRGQDFSTEQTVRAVEELFRRLTKQ